MSVREAGMSYEFMGESLGGRPEDEGCYDEDGRVDYSAVRVTATFQQGLHQLLQEVGNQRQVALICSELRPEHCHRSKLVAVAVSAAGIDVAHIDHDGTVVSQEDVILRLEDPQQKLFQTGPPESERSRGRLRDGG